MNNHFKISLLKYRHSLALGEVLNVGLLLLFSDEWRFIYPKKLSRLRCLYPDVEIDFLRNYLKNFEAHTEKLNKVIQKSSSELSFAHGFTLDNFMENVYSEFLPKDDSALQFSAEQRYVLYTNSREKIIENLYKKYFFPYESPNKRNPRDENIMLGEIRKYLKNFNLSVFERYFQKQEPKKVFNEKTALSFDLHWQNSQTHLVKPISFDLSQSSSIDQKASQYFGKFMLLQGEIQRGSYALDVPVSRPKDKALFADYDKALYVLEGVPSIKLIEEERLESYAVKVVEALTLHN
jgi:hypothetical protein